MKIICYSCGRGENPENTIEGIRHCNKVNPDWRIEMDVQITKDGKLILFHDENTERITGKNSLIKTLNLREVHQLNAGFNFQVENEFPYRKMPIRIPELQEVFIEFPRLKVLLDIHTDNEKIVPKLIELIEKDFPNGDFVIVSEFDNIIDEVRKSRADWTFGVPEKEAKKMLYSSFLFLDNFFPIKSDILMLPKTYGKIEVLRNRILKHARRRNKEIWAWMHEGKTVETINSVAEMNQFIELGVDGIFSEYPGKLFQELKDLNRI